VYEGQLPQLPEHEVDRFDLGLGTVRVPGVRADLQDLRGGYEMTFKQAQQAGVVGMMPHDPPAPASEGRSEELRKQIKGCLADLVLEDQSTIEETADDILALLAAHYPGAGVESARLDWLENYWIRLNDDPVVYGWKSQGGANMADLRQAIDAAMAQSAGRDDGRGGKAE